MARYVGLDADSKNCVYVIQDEDGRVTGEGSVPTTRSVRGCAEGPTDRSSTCRPSQHGRITRRGSNELRSILCEAAHHAGRPDPALAASFFISRVGFSNEMRTPISAFSRSSTPTRSRTC